jgi:hypothetical protein
MDQRSLCFADSLFDSMKLLGEIETGSSFIAAKMAFSSLQPFDDFRMRFMNVFRCHMATVFPRGIVQFD